MTNNWASVFAIFSIWISSFVLFDAATASERGISILKHSKLERGKGEIGHTERYGYKRVRGFSRRGKRSQRFEIRHGDCSGSRGWNDCKNDRGRIERKEAPRNRLTGRAKNVWLGFSIFVPNDYVPLAGGSLTSVIQTKVQGQSMPVWQFFMNGVPRITFADDRACNLGSLADWKGKWNDITIFADYRKNGKGSYFKLYRNGELLCDRKDRIIHSKIAGRRFQTYLKYGIYRVFVSRHLALHGTIPKKIDPSIATQLQLGWGSRAVKWPFKYDWGVKLPTQVIYFDEMLAGRSRKAVDVRMREAKGRRPVD